MDKENASKEVYKRRIINSLNLQSAYNFWYAMKYLLCEGLCLCNVIGQVWFLNRFFDGQFIEYGSQVMKFVNGDPKVPFNPMIRMFPRMTKCLFKSYGPSGQVETRDLLCLLPLNNSNDKIFLMIWFWFFILIILTTAFILFGWFTLICPCVRICLFRVSFPTVRTYSLQFVLGRARFGDWFLLTLIGHIVGDQTLQALLEEIDDTMVESQKV